MTTFHHVDDSVLVVEKPPDLLCVPGRGEDKQDCLIHRLQVNYPDALIVHRLDMATSGLLLVARNKISQRALSAQFQQRQVEKRYIAVVSGLLKQDSGEIDLPLIADWPNRPRQMIDLINGKKSLTYYRVLSRHSENNSSVVELSPITGRSHQLRLHMCAIGHPILGDSLYGETQGDGSPAHSRLMLHASRLTFTHPVSFQRLSFYSEAVFNCA